MPEQPQGDRQHGLALKPIAYAAGALVLVIVVVGLSVRSLAAAWNAPLAGPNAPLEMQIDRPALESAPQEEREQYFKEKEALLGRYEWIDRDHGIARIPIDTAIELLARRPAPADHTSAQP